MATFRYVDLLEFEVKINEVEQPYRHLSERHLQIVWLEQRMRVGLTTEDGKPITVISPGIWNFCAGPDFLNAHLKIDNRDYRGEIEIHLLEESWWKHGHHHNPNYSNVILHIFLQPKPINFIPERGCSSPNFNMGIIPYLIDSPTQLIDSIDLELYPYHYKNEPGKCSKHIFSLLSKRETLEFFQQAAIWRLRMKREALLNQTGDSTKATLLGCAGALGHPQNGVVFRNIFSELYAYKALPERELLAKALLMSGCFRDKFKQKWEEHPYYHKLHLLASNMRGEERFDLEFYPSRPHNHPVRRLGLLVKWLKDEQFFHHLFSRFRDVWTTYRPQLDQKKGSAKLWKAWRTLFPDYTDTHWESYYTFEAKVQTKKLTLMGDELFQRILINVLLPILEGILIREHDQDGLEAFYRFYHAQKAISSGKREYLQQRFFGIGDALEHADLLNSADVEQGALQLHRDFCMHYEASCEGCPFVERYREIVPIFRHCPGNTSIV